DLASRRAPTEAWAASPSDRRSAGWIEPPARGVASGRARVARPGAARLDGHPKLAGVRDLPETHGARRRDVNDGRHPDEFGSRGPRRTRRFKLFEQSCDVRFELS